MAGRFITLEGGEGVGKSTQLTALADALRAAGKSVVTTREPGGTEGAEAIRALLMTGEVDRWTDATEALLFAAARADHVARLIRPAVARGDWVLCDRFVDSTRAYQGGGGGISEADIMALHAVGSGGLLPDRTLLLAISREEAQKRADRRDGVGRDRMGSKDPAYHDKVAARFLAMAKAEPDRFRVVDASGSAGVVTQRLIEAVSDML